VSPVAILTEAARLLRAGAEALRSEARATPSDRTGVACRLLLRASLYDAGAKACGLLADGASVAGVEVRLWPSCPPSTSPCSCSG
jgi:hypothetical protein